MAGRQHEIVNMHRKLESADHFRVLGIDRETPADAIKRRYLELARTWHMDSFVTQDLDEELAEKAKQIFNRIQEAYETLTDVDLRDEYLTRLDRASKGLSNDVNAVLRAEQKLDEGLSLMAKRRWNQAKEAFSEAKQLNKDDPLIWAHLAYVTYRADGSEAAFKTASKELKEATKVQNNLPEAYLYLGTMHFERDEYKSSINYLSKCLKRAPKNVEAARLIRLARSRHEKASQRSPIVTFFERLLKR